MASTRETIRSALQQNLIDEDGKPVHVRLLPGLNRQDIEAFARSLPVPPPEDVRDLLELCSGIEGMLDQIDFTGRSLSEGFGSEFLLPYGLPIAHDGFGNFWAVDLQPPAPGDRCIFAVTMRRSCSCRRLRYTSS